MPKRTDIKKILIISSGPIVIGQACEFDYSGSQACKALREEGYETVLVNSNPATIMTDPGMADRTYIEPLDPIFIEKIIAKEKPDALLSTLGGQTGLNMGFFLSRAGILKKYGVEVIGADAEAIERAEDRQKFKDTMKSIGLGVPESGIATSVDEGMALGEKLGFPLILRPAFTMGGAGGACVYNVEELKKAVEYALEVSPLKQVLVEESVLGWKEVEFEVIRDCKDNVIIVTSMENVDAMGIHTGDSIVVAPAQSLTTEEFMNLENWCKKIIRATGINGGGTNIQFAVSPVNGEIRVIEINPRVSRSSALASKATGFPIARVAAKLAIGLSLDEIVNQVTGKTYTFFEPTVDYCVFKVCRFAFEKFPGADQTLTTSMKAVGEAMSIGRTFKESLQKGIRSLEYKRYGLGADGNDVPPELSEDIELIKQKLTIPGPDRIFWVRYAVKKGMTNQEIYDHSKIDVWFVDQMRQIVEMEGKVVKYKLKELPLKLLAEAKGMGFSDIQIAHLTKSSEIEVYNLRKEKDITAGYKLVDTCGGEVSPEKPYFYSTFDKGKNECRASNKRKIMVLGGGPNRIGQGIEFDYCCVHASYAIKEEGLEAIMVNSNPETVSTDFDTSDRLYFEPLTREDVLTIVEAEKPEGVIVQFGGQTPLNLAHSLQEAGVPILGTSVDSIDMAEDRKRFQKLLKKLKLTQPENDTAISFEEAKTVADRIGYPVVVRPSYVLGGRAMMIVYDEVDLEEYMQKAVVASPDRPILVDKFLEDAIEVDVDCVADGEDSMICGIMEHIEEAGIHSGDSACAIPTFSLSKTVLNEIRKATHALAKELKVKGLMNIQYAVKGSKLYVLEVNPRASRTVPFIAKATGVSWANIATKVMLGKTLKELGVDKEVVPEHFSVKEAVFPFNRFPGVDPILGPEMKSTGEVMGIDPDLGVAYIKAQIGAGQKLPLEGKVFISVNDRDKRKIVSIAKSFDALGYKIVTTEGTGEVLRKNGLEIEVVAKIGEGRPDVLDLIKNNEVHIIVNTPGDKRTKVDETKIRSGAIMHMVPIITTLSGAQATVSGLEATKKKGFKVKALQDYY
ncbi:MAG: carbamoyl-phosphate synthase large subunit [Candidatus Margulisbacteria bacterium]|nr:carbamoyl-phosphate synthase large subunit [Candidatus Margulisiibacteriota bacterium]MBU1021304.1 carbamoyl-phosphate synthase large subunit [Candidatus Margulisiibacteriota bacterium]MBU1729207.1 carbamoyl-phosphate synthase large subunit [Candidatus Margulisiibacteriota bacterium]MBU1954880.1 carbamoyl-phosphate synthase large subunit [Candidatus Margulisiibacteriota bacterium]